MSDPWTCQLQTPSDDEDEEEEETTERDPVRVMFDHYAYQVLFFSPLSDFKSLSLHPSFCRSICIFWYQPITVLFLFVRMSWTPDSSRHSWMTTSLTVSWFISCVLFFLKNIRYPNEFVVKLDSKSFVRFTNGWVALSPCVTGTWHGFYLDTCRSMMVMVDVSLEDKFKCLTSFFLSLRTASPYIIMLESQNEITALWSAVKLFSHLFLMRDP